jgi:hypothetical protein
MIVNSASVAIVMALSLAGPSPSDTGGASRQTAAAPLRLAAAKLWAPKKSKPKSDDDDDTAQKEEELLKPQKAKPGPRSAPAPRPAPRPAAATTSRPRHRIKMDESASEDEDDDDDSAGDDDDDEDHPKITKRRNRVVEEEEEDEDEEILPLPSVAVLRPRLVGLEVGTAVMGRSFHYNTPGQVDNKVRLGYQFALEAFPLLMVPSNFFRRIGIGASYEAESGDASVSLPNGTTSSLPASMGRWGFDIRYVITPHARFTLVPAIGYGSSTAKVDIPASLQSMTMGLPSMCTTDVAFPCLATANPYYMTFDVHARFAATPEIGLELAAGLMLGVGVQKGPGQISTAEATPSMWGYHVDVGGSLLVYREWLAVTALVPIRRYAYSFTIPAGSAANYRTAGDTNYGLLLGVAALGP